MTNGSFGMPFGWKIKMSNILLIGAGNIGSRHLQGLAKVKRKLSIYVTDPSQGSLDLSKERFEQIPGSKNHSIFFSTGLENTPSSIDLAIIATSSNIRKKVTESLLKKTRVRFIIFEKLLFQNKSDYLTVAKLLKRHEVRAWVNCSMRVTPFYKNLKKVFAGKRLTYILTGTKFGIATQAIHFIDHMAYLLDSYDFTVDTANLERKVLKSKRQGFSELTGTLKVNFKNGSTGVFTDFQEGDAPIFAQIISCNVLAVANETTREVWISKTPDWKMQPSKDPLSFQSDLTNQVAEAILKTGDCGLPTYKESSKVHLKLLEALLDFINSLSGKKYDYYPFT
jgi:predicted dehydrogenase